MRTLLLRLGEVICIGDEITVTLMAIHGESVTLKIQAPGRVAIAAAELVGTPLMLDQEYPSGTS